MIIPYTYSEGQESRTDGLNAWRSPLKHVNSVFSRHNSGSSSIKSAKSTSLSFTSTVDRYVLFRRTFHATLVMYTHGDWSFGQQAATLRGSRFLGTVDYNKAVMLRHLGNRDP